MDNILKKEGRVRAGRQRGAPEMSRGRPSPSRTHLLSIFVQHAKRVARHIELPKVGVVPHELQKILWGRKRMRNTNIHEGKWAMQKQKA